jgi:hypothetical protein
MGPSGHRWGKANHLEPIHTGGTTSITTRRTPAENKTATRVGDGSRTGILMAAKPELTGRTPAFFLVAASSPATGLLAPATANAYAAPDAYPTSAR